MCLEARFGPGLGGVVGIAAVGEVAVSLDYVADRHGAILRGSRNSIIRGFPPIARGFPPMAGALQQDGVLEVTIPVPRPHPVASPRPWSTLEAIVLGLVQGLTEFLPISSSGHLRIVPALFGWEDPGAGFTAVIQLGTMAAVLIYFRVDLWRIAGAWLRELRVPIRQSSVEAKLGWFILLGTIPISIFGFVFGTRSSRARAAST